MSLFKILRGPKSSLSSKSITDGYAYFTPDDGAFYIDVKKENQNTHQVLAEGRIRINPDVKVVEGVLSAAGWQNGKQVFSIEGYNPDLFHGTIGLSSSASLEIIDIATEADLYIAGEASGSITIGYKSKMPQKNIPICAILHEQIKGVAL